MGDVDSYYERNADWVAALLNSYRRTDPAVPVGAVLVIAHSPDREERLLDDLTRRPLRAPIATTTRQQLHQHWPTEPVWQIPAEPGRRRRLIELTP